jgi:Putative auto-transporter adhesin, head GIN domain
MTCIPRPARPMWRAAIVAVPAGLILLTSGCFFDEEGSGEMATVRYQDLDDVDIPGVAVLDDLDVAVVDPSRPQSARVTIDDNLFDRGYASVYDGVLALGYDGNGSVEPSQTPRVVLTVHSLDTIENRSDGDVVAMGLDGGSVDVVNTGDGTVAATGEVDRVEVDATGDGRVDLSRLVAGTVELNDTDDGEVAVHAAYSVDGEVSGAADVVVYGHPVQTGVELDGDGVLVAA